MKFLIVENDPIRAQKFEDLGVDIIFVDLEKLGKYERQAHIDSVKSNHSIGDISKVKSKLTTSKVLVRIDPINPNTPEQIDAVIAEGADIIMLPYFRKYDELKVFFDCIDNRIETMLLFEHIDALDLLPRAYHDFPLKRVFFGLNDLSLSLNYSFMFEVLSKEILNPSIEFLLTQQFRVWNWRGGVI
jgi:hypothetical protein